MPYGYGSANRRGPSGPGPGGQGARGQATQNPGRGGGWSPGVGGKQSRSCCLDSTMHSIGRR